jgi:hypothetical protein
MDSFFFWDSLCNIVLHLPYGRLDSWLQFYLNIKITIPKKKKKHFPFYPHPFLFLLCHSCSIISLSYILSPFRLHSVFLPISFSLSLSFRRIYSTYARSSFSPYSTFCTFLLHLPPNTCFLSPTSEFRHNFSFSSILHSQAFRNFLCRTPLTLPVVSGFFDSLPSFLLVRVVVPFT